MKDDNKQFQYRVGRESNRDDYYGEGDSMHGEVIDAAWRRRVEGGSEVRMVPDGADGEMQSVLDN